MIDIHLFDTINHHGQENIHGVYRDHHTSSPPGYAQYVPPKTG